MTARRSRASSQARQVARDAALARPELRSPPDGFARVAPASPHAAPVKAVDPATRALIDAAIETRGLR